MWIPIALGIVAWAVFTFDRLIKFGVTPRQRGDALGAALPASTQQVNFCDDLGKRRRQGWIFLAACVAVASNFGIVLSAIVWPIILVVMGGLFKLALKLGIGGAPARAGVATIHDFAVRSAAALHIPIGHYASVADTSASATLLQFAVPPLLIGALVWWSLHSLFLRVSAVHLVRHFGARPARVDDFLERQFVDIVEEAAVGSGTPAPKPFVVNSSTMNATVLGRGPDRAALLVTRGLLDQLDRDETEAIITRLVTGLAAGDLRVASGIMATFHTFFFFLTVLSLPFRLSAWRTLSRLALLIATPRPRADSIVHVCTSLQDSAQIDSVAFLKVAMFFWSPFILNPPMRALWRNRCFWSDAQTVKLTRAPDTFARALQKIGTVEPPPATEVCAWLFIGTPTPPGNGSFTDHQHMNVVLPPEFMERVKQLRTMRVGARAPRDAVTTGLRVGFVTLLWGATLSLSAATALAFELALGLPLVVLLV